MHRNFLVTGALLSGIAVILGAFGAHGLQKITSEEKIVQGFQTAVQYQLWHSFALMLTGVLYSGAFSPRLLRWAAICFITGIFLFSGSLYLLGFLKIQESPVVKIAGPVTPVGGLFFILGWLILVIALLKKKAS
ncbi:MAG: DUF423 domain-containing protein [Bacteroidetes bacterium]|nr:DUF423 domain-containing protein [Bacteroidota bacterium]